MPYWMAPDGSCHCPQCMADDEPEADPFWEWAEDECERQYDMNEWREGEDLDSIAFRCGA